MKTIKELQSLIIEWAKEKNLNDPNKQYLKILEEVGETAKAILEGNQEEIKDGIGDIAVTVIIYNNILSNYINCNIRNSFSIRADCDILFDILNNSFDEDILGVINRISIKHNTTLEECLNIAWNEIKDRKGKTVNGTFIKNG